MQEAMSSPLAAWESFYVIVGTSAAALTGLQFVVIALVAESGATGSSQTIAAFGTPTVVHFCAVVLVAAILSAPWRSLSNVDLAIGASGAAGVAYTAIVIRRARRQKGYVPVFEDWLWHAILPILAYSALVVAAIILQGSPEPALFVVGGAALLLLFIGIHNAWDTVTYVAVERWPLRNEPREPVEGERVRNERREQSDGERGAT